MFDYDKEHIGVEIYIKHTIIGRLYNIRAELDEDITNGVQCSEVLKALCGSNCSVSPENVVELLGELGHKQFMSFSGKSYLGKFEGLSLS